MAEVIAVEKKGNILTRPSLPCLSRYHTINLTAGCPYECRYCYAQSFRSYPGHGRVMFRANALDLLRYELPRKRSKPALVYFSTACEPFMQYDCILAVLYEMMELLLDHSIFLLISTKSRIPEKFLRLFAQHRELVHVQVGLTTTDDDTRKLLEPNAATVDERLATIRALISHGLRAEVRMDPLVPELTDTQSALASLCKEMSRCGARQATASYLFLRKANYARLAVNTGGWSFRKMAKRLYTHRIEKYCGSGTIHVPSPNYRQDRYEQLMNIARDHGISLSICRCKNPDVVSGPCHPHPPTRDDSAGQSMLFS